jgi:hypothetical protein
LVAFTGLLIGLCGELQRSCRIIEEIQKLNPFLPGWLHTAAFLCYLERGEYADAFHEARQIRSPGLVWDPLIRAAAAGLADKVPAAASAYRELMEQFPEFAKDPADTIRILFHFDHWVDAMLEGLEKARHAAS